MNENQRYWRSHCRSIALMALCAALSLTVQLIVALAIIPASRVELQVSERQLAELRRREGEAARQREFERRFEQQFEQPQDRREGIDPRPPRHGAEL